MILPLILSLIYLALCLFLARGLRKKNFEMPSHKKGAALPSVAVLVAARNEETTLPHLLDSLKEQSIPPNEIIIVNDRSEDGTAAVIARYMRTMKNLSTYTIHDIPGGVCPKKHALTEAIRQSHSEILLQTDADALVPPRWVETMTAPFREEKTALVQGITFYTFAEKSSPFLRTYQDVDFLSYDIIGAAAIGARFPLSSNANNLAYRRRAYEQLEKLETTHRIVSGDDDFLLQHLWQKKEGKIHFCLSPDVRVQTTPCYTWRELLNQRARWGSKTVFYAPMQRLFLGAIFLFYLAIPLSLLPAIIGLWSPYTPILLLMVKIVGESFFLIPGARLFQVSLPAHGWAIIPASILQLGIVLYSVFRGVFGSFSWKKQVFKKTI
ncbi:glycosyltransferase [Chitinivibrio alkaliphilus]|uniref:Glycosyl transferase family 2 n=1 Tax=Chitinivibrio alkaliphilus ACht1 TaxID=1313304 RepID=U7D6J0_9BACT|nr:glycosyltransferase [Chitinivibrio alkaliphilus]ERP32134.1 glycosyl transferase family 2 [Chitinivibrio alkaliphilus ACht1]